MSSQNMEAADWTTIQGQILRLEAEGVVTRTFRRLDPDRQEAILLAIVDEAVDRGPANLNIKKVAARAGVSVGALYTYFPNRDGLLRFAVTLCARFMAEALEAFRSDLVEMPLTEGLEAYLSGGVEWSRAYAGLIRLFARAAYHGEPELEESLVRPVATVLRSLVHDMLAAAQARGEVRADIDLDTMARIVHALTIAVGDALLLPYLNAYFQVVAGDALPPERALAAKRVFTAAIDLILRGLGAR